MPTFRPPRRGFAATALAVLVAISAGAIAGPPPLTLKGDPAAGKKIAMDRSKGNCIACHIIPGGESPGAIGPALIAMKGRYPSEQALYAQVWDPTVKNPWAVMPPFGRYEILTPQELADVVAFVWSL
jgi:sulfur-oxidizing protein SoxX